MVITLIPVIISFYVFAPRESAIGTPKGATLGVIGAALLFGGMFLLSYLSFFIYGPRYFRNGPLAYWPLVIRPYPNQTTSNCPELSSSTQHSYCPSIHYAKYRRLGQVCIDDDPLAAFAVPVGCHGVVCKCFDGCISVYGVCEEGERAYCASAN